MEKGEVIEVVNGEFLLPEAIIQHIQSFLNGKEAAQTSILSKSWYNAWSTRPNLDFHERYFRRDGGDGDSTSQFQFEVGFLEFVKKTMQRYQELNLKIESFRLWTRRCEEAHELIVKAIQLGATDLNLGFIYEENATTFVLPHEVLGAENLIRLSVHGCQIGRGVDAKVCCSGLKSLSLSEVDIEADTIWDIISSCPLIERLSLSGCTYSVQVQILDDVMTFNRRLALSPCVEFGEQSLETVVGGQVRLYEFHKLKYLWLTSVNIDTLFFRDFTSKFPCLKNLGLSYCNGYEGLEISSPSLESIRFVEDKMLRAKFDVPRLRWFHLSGSDLPSLSFETASRRWASSISISCNQPSTSWFLELKTFLKNLSLSKIFLSLDFGDFLEQSLDYAIDVQGLPRPTVENLRLSMLESSKVHSAQLDGLFLSCRPKVISLWPSSWMFEATHDLEELLCKTLIQEVSQNCCIPNRNMLGLYDLKEVNVEISELSDAGWRSLPCKALLDASTTPAKRRKIVFKLRWGQESLTFK